MILETTNGLRTCEPRGNLVPANQNYYPDLGSKLVLGNWYGISAVKTQTPLSHGDQWWHCEMMSVHSGYCIINLACYKLSLLVPKWVVMVLTPTEKSLIFINLALTCAKFDLGKNLLQRTPYRYHFFIT